MPLDALLQAAVQLGIGGFGMYLMYKLVDRTQTETLEALRNLHVALVEGKGCKFQQREKWVTATKN